jgi:hypothetical protein
MLLYDVDAMEAAVNSGGDLDDSYYHEAWWFTMTV